MTFLVALVFIVALGAVLRRVAAPLLSLAAWFLLVGMGLSVAVGVAVPGAVLAAGVALWMSAQVLRRLRHGGRSSAALRTIGRIGGALRAAG